MGAGSGSGVRGLNGVAVAQNGLIFGQDEATGSGKVSGYLRGLQDTIQNSKIPFLLEIQKFNIWEIVRSRGYSLFQGSQTLTRALSPAFVPWRPLAP